MLNLGCECVGWWNQTDNNITKDFNEKHPDIPRFTNKEDLLANNEQTAAQFLIFHHLFPPSPASTVNMT